MLVRQVLGAISQFEKASLVAKLKAARERKRAAGGPGSGRFPFPSRPILQACRNTMSPGILSEA